MTERKRYSPKYATYLGCFMNKLLRKRYCLRHGLTLFFRVCSLLQAFVKRSTSVYNHIIDKIMVIIEINYAYVTFCYKNHELLDSLLKKINTDGVNSLREI